MFGNPDILSSRSPARSPLADVQLLARHPQRLEPDDDLADVLERPACASCMVSSVADSAHCVQILGWAGYIKVDGSTFHWLGSPVPGNASTWISTEITPTRTILTLEAGPMQLNVTFLSPVEVRRFLRSPALVQ
jgi:hypothetical protein